MFEGKELKTARKSASNKHDLYVEMREMYVKLSETYVKIRVAVDELLSQCSPGELMEKYIKLYIGTDVVSEPYSMPMLLADGHILTLQDPWTDPVTKTDAEITKGFYIDNSPLLLWNYEEEYFTEYGVYKYYDVNTIKGQMEWEPVLREYSNTAWILKNRFEDTSPIRFLKRKKLKEQLEEAQRQFDEKKREASEWFENGATPDQIANLIFSKHGIRKRKFAKDFSYKTNNMLKDAFPIRRPKNLSESEEIAYWKSYEGQLDQEIQNIRRYVPAEDDMYIAYEAYVNGIDKTQVPNLLHNDVSLYRLWLSASCVAYFKQLINDSESYRNSQAESRKSRARFIANLTSLGAYHVDDGCVTGYGLDPYLVSGRMSDKYSSIQNRAQRAFNSDVEYLNEKWKRFDLE